MSVQPEAFWSTEPPERIIGSECEYGVQAGSPAQFANTETLRALGYQSHSGYMGSAGGAGRIYSDMGHLEHATAEVMGPAAAAVQDLEGVERVADIVTRSGHVHRGVYRTAGTFIPNGQVGGPSMRTSEGATSGYHSNFMFPRVVEFDPLFDPLIATSLAVRPAIAGSGTLREEGFVLSQKVWGVGGAPVAHSVERRTQHGNKPMAMVPGRSSDVDTIGGDERWARLEVRMADPGLSLVSRFLDFAVTSLTLRLIELQRAEKRDAKSLLSGEHLSQLCLAQPLDSAKRFAADMSLQRIAQTRSGRRVTIVDVNEGLLDSFEQLNQEVALPAAECLAVLALRMVIDELRSSRPDQADYTQGALATLDYARRHTFVSISKPQAEVRAQDTRMLFRDLLWGQIVPDPSLPESMACLGKRYWAVKNNQHELTPKIRRLADDSGMSPRAIIRASVIDASNGSMARNWATYEDPLGVKRSFGDAYGEELLAA